MEQLLDKWLEVVKQVGGQSWEIFVRWVYISSWVNLGLGLLFLLLAVVGWGGLWIRFTRLRRACEDLTKNPNLGIRHCSDLDDLVNNSLDAFLIVLGIVAGLGTLGGLWVLVSSLSGVLYPEGTALWMLMRR